jgi:hypothetical protein
MRRSALALAVVVAALAAGCGGQKENDLPIERSAPAVTSPDTDRAYETGGADGSGADGNPGDQDQESRGGVAAGPDNTGERK